MSGWSELVVLGVAGPTGAFFSTFKPLLLVVLLPPWLYAATWIHKDAQRVHSVQLMWNALALGSGALGVLLWVLLPWYLAGLLVYLALTAGVVGAYVFHRNARVVPEARVLTGEHIRSVLSRTKRQRVEVVQHLKLYNAEGKSEPAPTEEFPEQRRAYNVVQEFLNDVVKFRASRAELVPAGDATNVRFLIDGVQHKRPAVPREDAALAIDYLKQIAGLDPQEKRRPQTGSISMDVGAVRADMKVHADGTTHGQRLVLNVIQEMALTRLEDLGMSDEVRSRVEKLNAAEKGLLIVSSPRGNGLTSTLYSLLRKHDAFMQHLVTLEAAVTVELENITQETYRDQTELPAKLGSLLRRDPDVVVVDDCRQAQTAKLIADAAGGKNIILGVVAENTFVALARWVKTCGDRAIAVQNLHGITSQVLLRKLCPECRQAYRPPQAVLAKLNLPTGKIERFYRPPREPLTDEKGRPVVCSTCRGTGYLGRTAAFELLEMTDDIRQLVIADASLSQIKGACRKNKMLYLQEQALRKVIAGITSVEEVVRVSRRKQQ